VNKQGRRKGRKEVPLDSSITEEALVVLLMPAVHLLNHLIKFISTSTVHD